MVAVPALYYFAPEALLCLHNETLFEPLSIEVTGYAVPAGERLWPKLPLTTALAHMVGRNLYSKIA